MPDFGALVLPSSRLMYPMATLVFPEREGDGQPLVTLPISEPVACGSTHSNTLQFHYIYIVKIFNPTLSLIFAPALAGGPSLLTIPTLFLFTGAQPLSWSQTKEAPGKLRSLRRRLAIWEGEGGNQSAV